MIACTHASSKEFVVLAALGAVTNVFSQAISCFRHGRFCLGLGFAVVALVAVETNTSSTNSYEVNAVCILCQYAVRASGKMMGGGYSWIKTIRAGRLRVTGDWSDCE